MPFIDVRGRAIYAECQGSGPAVLFLHGAGSNAATWWQQLPAFAARHTCITLDQRCFGRSVAPMDEFRHELFTGDALAVLDHFGIGRAVVVGQSLGGMVGLRLALGHADRLAAFVACDSPLGLDHPAILRALGCDIACTGQEGYPPLTLTGQAGGSLDLSAPVKVLSFSPGAHWKYLRVRNFLRWTMISPSASKEIVTPASGFPTEPYFFEKGGL